MGIFGKLKEEFINKGELIDIIEWIENSPGILVSRFERKDNEIKNGAKLIVRPGQKAVFVNEGQIADAFTPGTYTLKTANLPLLSTLKGWKYGFDSPFKAEVYFIKTTEQLDRKWGTPNPVMLRDLDFGIVRLRARGNFSYAVTEDKDMITKFVGTESVFTADNIEKQLRTKIISSFSDCIGELKIPALELAAQYNEISDFVKKQLVDSFAGLGLKLITYTLENISLPEEVEKAIDQRASLGALGGVNTYSQIKAADALGDAANNQGGVGSMMGMMLGGQFAGAIGGAMNPQQQQQQQQQQQVQQPSTAAVSTAVCAKCNAENAQNAKFCSGCGESMLPPSAKCVKCDSDIAIGAKFCPECGSPQELKCSECSAILAIGAKFCPECGNKA